MRFVLKTPKKTSQASHPGAAQPQKGTPTPSSVLLADLTDPIAEDQDVPLDTTQRKKVRHAFTRERLAPTTDTPKERVSGQYVGDINAHKTPKVVSRRSVDRSREKEGAHARTTGVADSLTGSEEGSLEASSVRTAKSLRKSTILGAAKGSLEGVARSQNSSSKGSKVSPEGSKSVSPALCDDTDGTEVSNPHICLRVAPEKRKAYETRAKQFETTSELQHFEGSLEGDGGSERDFENMSDFNNLDDVEIGFAPGFHLGAGTPEMSPNVPGASKKSKGLKNKGFDFSGTENGLGASQDTECSADTAGGTSSSSLCDEEVYEEEIISDDMRADASENNPEGIILEHENGALGGAMDTSEDRTEVSEHPKGKKGRKPPPSASHHGVVAPTAEIVPAAPQGGMISVEATGHGERKILSPVTLVDATSEARKLRRLPQLACSTCANAGECPEYREGYVCAYNDAFMAFPARDIDSVEECMREIVTSNMARLRRAQFFENAQNGGQLDPQVTRQSSVVYDQLASLRSLQAESKKVSVQFVGDQAQERTQGILSKLFGGGVVAGRVAGDSREIGSGEGFAGGSLEGHPVKVL